MKALSGGKALFQVASLLIFVLQGSFALGQNAVPAIAGCLPSSAGAPTDSDECALSHRSPPLLRQDVHVTGCSILPQNLFQVPGATLMQCSVRNGSNETVESFDYGIRYISSQSGLLLAEGGLGKNVRYNTTNIDGGLQPGEERPFNFLGPVLPVRLYTPSIKIEVEVTRVYVPGSRQPR